MGDSEMVCMMNEWLNRWVMGWNNDIGCYQNGWVIVRQYVG